MQIQSGVPKLSNFIWLLSQPLQLSQAKFLRNHSEPSEVRGAVFLKEITGSDPAYSMDFLKSHLIMNAPLSVDHFQSSLFDGFAVAPTQK